MYISKLEIEGYRNCRIKSQITFNRGLNILVGENASGKTTIINALRMLLRENEFSYMSITEEDFFCSFSEQKRCENIKLAIQLSDLTEDEKITFLTWCDADFEAKLHLEVDSKPTQKGYYRKTIWGGASKSSAFEEETFEYIDCIYLPPLRDAEEKLTSGRKSRLATLLKHQYLNEEEETSLVEAVNNFNKSLIDNNDGKCNQIVKARNDINETLKISMGKIFGQSINLQFTETTFNSILQSIKMVFFPELDEQDITKFRDIALNSLGYNNILYIATVLAELKAVGKDKKIFKVLLIEEPEAHLHPQLQIKLIKYLENVVKNQENMQIILTTHSPVLASSVSIDNIIHISAYNDSIKSAQLSKLDLGSSKDFINRWLDITKSTLFFAKGVILVEGISESLLIPELAKLVLFKHNQSNPTKKLPETLEEAGVSVININGVNFKHFMKIFCNVDDSKSDVKLPIRCSGITDNDPGKILEEIEDKEGKKHVKSVECYPSPGSNIEGTNSAITLCEKINNSTYARLYVSPYKTFEYDLALEKNTKIMAEVIKSLWPNEGSVKNRCNKIIEKNNNYQSNEDLRTDSIFIYEHINSDEIGKGIYAQVLGKKISEIIEKKEKDLDTDSILKIPDYIYKAVVWACGGDINE